MSMKPPAPMQPSVPMQSPTPMQPSAPIQPSKSVPPPPKMQPSTTIASEETEELPNFLPILGVGASVVLGGAFVFSNQKKEVQFIYLSSTHLRVKASCLFITAEYL